MTIRIARRTAAVALLGFTTIGFALPSANPAPAPIAVRKPTAPRGYLSALESPQSASESDARVPWAADFSTGAAAPTHGLNSPAIPLGGGNLWKETALLTGEIYDGVIPLASAWTFKKANFFGQNIAVSEDTLVAISPFETVNPLYPDPSNGPQQGPGKIHIFEKLDGAWQRVQELDFPTDVVGTTYNAAFGSSMAISGDTLLISAPGGNVSASRPGEVYVYQRIDGVWQQTQVLTDGIVQGGGGNFGYSIALQGNHALIANYAENLFSGAVYAFSESGGTWTQTQTLTLPDTPPFALFGARLALDGSTALIAAAMTSSDVSSTDPFVDVYELDESSGQWNAAQRLTSCGATADSRIYNFGSEMALVGDTAVITDSLGSTVDTPDYTEAPGIACAFTRSNDTWTSSQVLTAANGAGFAYFGGYIAMSSDLLAIGSNYVPLTDNVDVSGAIYVFSRDGSGWSQADEILESALSDGINDSIGTGTPIGMNTLAINGSEIFSALASAGSDVGGIRIFDHPAVATAAPQALTLSLAAGAQTSATLHIGNVSTGVALGFELTDGGTLTQISDETPVPSMGSGIPLCRTTGVTVLECVEEIGTAGTSWYRRFYFDEYPQVGASATIDAVTVGIEGAPAGIPVSVQLYTKPHDDSAIDTLDPYQLELIGGGSAVADGTPHSLLRVPISGTATVPDTANQDLVVEYHVDDWSGMPLFVAGANASPQTHKTFMTSPYGEFYVPGSEGHTAQGTHILISPHLDPAASGIGCATPANTPWLAATPGDGRVDAGGSQDLAVTVDASTLAPGHYSTELCVATKSPLPSMLRVPVELTVLDANDSIFQDGFDSAQP